MGIPATLSSVPAATPYTQYVATNGQTVFPYPFVITQDSDLVVVVNGVTQPTDSGYSLSGVGNSTGGNVTFISGQTAGAIITLYRNIAIQRITQISQNSGFSSTAFNAEYNNIYLILQQLQESIALSLQIPNTNSPAPTTTLVPANYANKYLSFDANGNPTPAVLTANGTITQSIVAGVLSPTLASEVTAGVTVVNHFYNVGVVDRYGTNSIPGTTDMTVAVNAAAAVCMVAGGLLTFGTATSYLVTAPINLTVTGAPNVGGVLVQGYGGTDGTFGILANHTGVAVFDCTGNDCIQFSDILIRTTGSSPQTGILTARNSSGGSLITRYTRVKIIGSFSVAPFYNYGSENDVHFECYYWNTNTAAGTKTMVFTSSNISGLVSPFTTIATGSKSCIDHDITNCLQQNAAGTATSDCIYIEGVDSLKIVGGWATSSSGAASGRAIVYVNTVNQASNFCSILGLTCEHSGSFSQNNLLFVDNAGVSTNIGWSVKDCRGVTNSYTIQASGGNTTMNSLHTSNISELSSHGMSFNALTGSVVINPGLMTILTSTNNLLVGDTSSWTIPTRVKDNWIETGSGNATFAPGIATGVNGWTAVGAITQRAKLEYSGRRVIFSIVIAGATSIAWTANATIPTMPGVAIDTCSCDVTDATLGTLIGRGVISASTLTLPVAQTATAHTIIVSGEYFVA